MFDLFAAGFADDPYPHYARLRETAPAYRHPLGFWLLSRYDDVARLQRAPHSVDERDLTEIPVWKRDGDVPVEANRPMRGLSMLDQNPPRHTRLRRLVSQAFTRGSVEALAPRVGELVDAALDRVAATGDVLGELAFPLPFTVISELLGIPPVEHARLRELTGILVRALEPLTGPELQAEIRAANDELTELTRELIGWKRTHPGDDLVTALLAARDGDEVLTEDELLAQVMFLYIAGHETTVNLIANGILALVRNPSQARLLRADPSCAAAAVEELVRYDTSVHLMRRITVDPLVVRGERIPAGSFVVACLAAANRDPEFWGPDADVLRLDRPDAHRHLSFGSGIHHCLGAALARLEARVAFTRFVRRFPSAEVAELRWNGRINVRGPAELTLAV
ncbi:cytochrome P450 [Amycolatopsis thermoflava]|uniref:Cytochrome P450 n=1 Tax=Amycolatopsis thermoflava TaxID=84480 RepID=A0A3N2H7Z1_9PSEU|nr:cytochrome P450 [Amycolatopsis thermoflava]ROS44225.1 cytochrome P450 [Amycolatopsis thermoflava]